VREDKGATVSLTKKRNWREVVRASTQTSCALKSTDSKPPSKGRLARRVPVLNPSGASSKRHPPPSGSWPARLGARGGVHAERGKARTTTARCTCVFLFRLMRRPPRGKLLWWGWAVVWMGGWVGG
jgi:hypothetical protein